MANNRMWMVNHRTGDRILIAKYYPTDGWKTKDDGTDGRPALHELLNAAFGRDPVRADATMWGVIDWEIEYEVAP